MRALALTLILVATGCGSPFGADPDFLEFAASADRYTAGAAPQPHGPCGERCQLAPRIRAVTAVRSIGDALAVQIEGGDPNSDVVAVGLATYDADGALLEKWQASTDLWGASSFTFADFPALASTLDVVEVGVIATDAGGRQSVEVRAPVGDAAVRTLGEVCDPIGVADYCAEGVCDQGVCADNVECPDNAHATAIEVDQSAWGSMRCTANASAGSCGGQVGRDVPFAVTLPTAGSYTARITFEGEPMETVLYARTHCGGAQTEIGCAAGTELTFEAEAGVVFVWVDSVDPETWGAFEVSVMAAP